VEGTRAMVREVRVPEVLPAHAPSFIVGLGASAGGLQALQALLAHIERDSDMAFVVVTHRDPSHASMLTSLLQSVTPLPVMDAADGLFLQPGRVYVGPADQDLAFANGRFRFLVRPDNAGRNLPIDAFFRSSPSSGGAPPWVSCSPAQAPMGRSGCGRFVGKGA
jgi:two-component system, chemotaxis family, CheB/CheR fusion protein